MGEVSLKDLIKRIIEEDRIPDILEKAECDNIRLVGNRYEAQLPPKFSSDNRRSVQIYLNEDSIVCKIRSRPFAGSSIFDLISYLVFDCTTEEEMRKCFPKSKNWICNILGYEEYIDQFYEFFKPKPDPLGWLDKILKQEKRINYNVTPNSVYDESILDNFIMVPYSGFIDEGISIETQKRYQIGLDIHSERVIFPIRNSSGEIVSIKGRYIGKYESIPKYMYLINFNKSIELYNWHLAVEHILRKKEVIIFEGEKSVWKATQWGFDNCVALGGGDISEYQAKMILDLGLDISICLAFDKDVEVKNIKQRAKVFGYTNSIYILYDDMNLFSAEEKHSPTDLGEEKFRILYDRRLKHKFV